MAISNCLRAFGSRLHPNIFNAFSHGFPHNLLSDR
jgi:hypothetical protein